MADHPDGQPQSLWQERNPPAKMQHGSEKATERMKERSKSSTEDQIGMDWEDRFGSQQGELDREVQQIRRTVNKNKR